MRTRPPILCCASLLMLGCAGTARPELFDPGTPTPPQRERLKEAERAYRAGEPGFAAMRQELAADPITAFWLTRMLVRDLMFVREGRETGRDEQRVRLSAVPDVVRSREAANSEPLLRAAAGIKDPVEARALEQIDALGAAAVPCIVEDLARHNQTYVRQLGVELLGRLGPAALPGLQPLLRSSNARERQTGAQAVGAMPPSALTFDLLRALATDGDYTVRAAALRGMTGGDAAAGTMLRQALIEDPEAFARRAAAVALASHRDVATAEALIDYLEQCKRERDARGEEAAQDSLQTLARSHGPRSAAAWRNWARTFDPGATR